MGRIQGLFEAGPFNGDSIVKTTEGYVFSLTVSWKGLTVGDIVCQLCNSVDAAGSSDPAKQLVTVYAATANGTWSREWSQGKHFSTGIFYKEGAAGGASGAILAELTAK